MNTLTLPEYADHIDLFHAFQPELVSGSNIPDLTSSLLSDLDAVTLRLGIDEVSHLNLEKQRALLDAALTVLPPNTLTTKGIRLLNTLLQLERQQRLETAIAQITHTPTVSIGSVKLVLWQGDITTLQADAIVNAANSQMLGCFLPHHKCIDNVIHSRAGTQLRADCNTIIQEQGNDESTGNAKITRAYNLPARYVIHTVGPIVHSLVNPTHERLLASCYHHILDLCESMPDIRSVAFCSISTGVFGYPIAQAAPVAFRTVTNWLTTNPGQLDTVIFNVFSDYDFSVYQNVIEDFLCQQ